MEFSNIVKKNLLSQEVIKENLAPNQLSSLNITDAVIENDSSTFLNSSKLDAFTNAVNEPALQETVIELILPVFEESSSQENKSLPYSDENKVVLLNGTLDSPKIIIDNFINNEISSITKSPKKLIDTTNVLQKICYPNTVSENHQIESIINTQNTNLSVNKIENSNENIAVSTIERTTDSLLEKKNHSIIANADAAMSISDNFNKAFTLPPKFLPKKKRTQMQASKKLPSAGTSDGWYNHRMEKLQKQKIKEEKLEKKKKLQKEKKQLAEEKKKLLDKMKEIQLKIKQETE